VDGGFRPRGGIIGGGAEGLTWPRPVRPGDALRVTAEVLEVRPSRSRPGQGIARVRCTTLNQDDLPVQVFVANLVVFART
jgi:acyl dehydratase